MASAKGVPKPHRHGMVGECAVAGSGGAAVRVSGRFSGRSVGVGEGSCGPIGGLRVRFRRVYGPFCAVRTGRGLAAGEVWRRFFSAWDSGAGRSIGSVSACSSARPSAAGKSVCWQAVLFSAVLLFGIAGLRCSAAIGPEFRTSNSSLAGCRRLCRESYRRLHRRRWFVRIVPKFGIRFFGACRLTDAEGEIFFVILSD